MKRKNTDSHLDDSSFRASKASPLFTKEPHAKKKIDDALALQKSRTVSVITSLANYIYIRNVPKQLTRLTSDKRARPFSSINSSPESSSEWVVIKTYTRENEL
jgi:hypothetical protein